ncbi:MAG: hypothetical protein JWN03_2736 [Nocardia sp.]|uniref:hypothetical protein n=1 Tax=Nocardia sp. TaxID=1821 RepID=UPI0026296A1F|nr:hypothetical protein [Nocardia sp.]MCU1642461.1 hypothetical protein [Nocardia sp.]
MTTPSIGLLDRYQDYRIRRWHVRDERISGMLPKWRNQRRRRKLVIVVAVAIGTIFLTGLLCVFNLKWAPLIAVAAAVVMIPAWTMLRIASNGYDHAPAEALDEFEIQQRDTARSMGLAVSQSLTVLPIFYLIFAGAFDPKAEAFRTAYAGGMMGLAALMAGGCAPAMILGWNRPDPEPEP